MTKQEVLLLLQQAGGALSGEQISRTLGVSRAAVWKAIGQLRQEGYEITAATRRGYRLVRAPDRLDAAQIAQLLCGHPWMQRAVVLDTVDSTNNVARRLAAQGAPSGTTVFAEQQTAGRGRRGRSFYSPAGEGLYCSVLLRPQVQPQKLMHLTAMAAVAAMDAVEAVCGRRVGIKWTNDLVIGTRKLAGILTELSLIAETQETDYVIVGVGINCAQREFPAELAETATSLRREWGVEVCRCTLAAELMRAFSRMETALLTQKEAWLERFAENCVTVGKPVKLVRGDSVRYAHADGIGPDAALLVTYDDGTQEAVASGEVSVRGMYGYL